ncbi:MAG: MFS transporter [Bacteroidales bacterium]
MTVKQKYSILFSLYLAQSIPMSFFSTVLPVIMRMENYSLASIGLLQLIKIPWILKFLWAPLVDRNAENNMHYRRWIISAEIFYAVVIVAIGFFNLDTQFTTIIVLMIMAFMLSATQDIASDALAVRILKKKERSYGNSLQSSGNFLGTLIGSGVLLMLYSMMGWTYLMFLLSAIVLLALIPISRYRQKSVKSAKEEIANAQPKKRVSLKDIPGFFQQPKIGRRVVLLVLIYSGIVGILAMLKPYMVDLGYSIREIAIMTGVFGTAFGAASSFLGAYIMRKTNNKLALRIFTIYAFVGALYLAFLTMITPGIIMLYTGIALIWSAYGMCAVGVYTISMNTVRSGREGTDYTLQIVLTHLSSLMIVVISGRIGDWLGYTGLFFIEALLALTVSFLINYLYHDPELEIIPKVEYQRKSA